MCVVWVFLRKMKECVELVGFFMLEKFVLWDWFFLDFFGFWSLDMI